MKKFDIIEGDLELTALVDAIAADTELPSEEEQAAAAAAHGDSEALARADLANVEVRLAAATSPAMHRILGGR